MLELDTSLPPGAPCAAAPGAIPAAFDGALWWHGTPAQMEQDAATGAPLHPAARPAPPPITGGRDA
jgi:hypothetical protein